MIYGVSVNESAFDGRWPQPEEKVQYIVSCDGEDDMDDFKRKFEVIGKRRGTFMGVWYQESKPCWQYLIEAKDEEMTT